MEVRQQRQFIVQVTRTIALNWLLVLAIGCAEVTGNLGFADDELISAGAPEFHPPKPSVSGKPVLLYSDLVRGPSGSMVTVWGQNIPKNVNLMCGNEPCEILSFGFDPMHPAHGRQPARQKIVVRFKSGSKISLDGFNSLPFSLTNGKIHQITGDEVVMRGVSSGDVVYLRGGHYSKPQKCYGSYAIICGEYSSGIAVVGYPGERAILDCSGVSAFDAADKLLHNFTLANLEMDCGGIGRAIRASRIGERRNLRIIGNYLHHARSRNSGAFGEFSNTSNLYILGNLIEQTGITGQNNAHAIYHGGRGKSENVHISYNHINTHEGGRPIQIYGHRSGEVMRGLVIRGNHIVNVHGNAAILVSHSDSPHGLSPDDPKRGWVKDALIDFNTVHGCSGSGISIRNSGVDVQINNNVLFELATPVYIDFANTARVLDNCMNSSVRSKIPIVSNNNKENYPDCL